MKLNIEVIYLNSNNKEILYEKYNLDNTKIPSVFINEKLVCYGKIREDELKKEIEKYLI